MPSNKTLAKEAHDLAKQLDIEVVTDGLSNEKLADLVSDLKAKLRDSQVSSQADEQTPAKFVIAEGKAITSARGILDAGREVLPGDINTEAFKKFYDLGFIVKG